MHGGYSGKTTPFAGNEEEDKEIGPEVDLESILSEPVRLGQDDEAFVRSIVQINGSPYTHSYYVTFEMADKDDFCRILLSDMLIKQAYRILASERVLHITKKPKGSKFAQRKMKPVSDEQLEEMGIEK